MVTIIGDSSANLVALSFILAKVEEDPQSGSCLNISYSEIQGLVANFNPTGSPYAQNGTSGVASSASSNAGAPSSSAQTGEQHMDTSVSRLDTAKIKQLSCSF